MQSEYINTYICMYLTRNVFPINASNFLKQLQFVFTCAPTRWQLSYLHTYAFPYARTYVYICCMCVCRHARRMCDIYASQCDKQPLEVVPRLRLHKHTLYYVSVPLCVCIDVYNSTSSRRSFV